MLFIDPAVGREYVSDISRDRFDRVVGKILIDSDWAVVDMPQELGAIFLQRVRRFAYVAAYTLHLVYCR
jgi:hypothetical protein